MKGTVKISARIGYHLNLADMKLRARRVKRTRLFAAEVIGDHRRRQTLVSDHTVMDGVANVDDVEIVHAGNP